MPNIGVTELLIILFIIVLFFGARKLPEVARGLGQGIREFKKAASSSNDESPNKSEKIESGKN